MQLLTLYLDKNTFSQGLSKAERQPQYNQIKTSLFHPQELGTDDTKFQQQEDFFVCGLLFCFVSFCFFFSQTLLELPSVTVLISPTQTSS